MGSTSSTLGIGRRFVKLMIHKQKSTGASRIDAAKIFMKKETESLENKTQNEAKRMPWPLEPFFNMLIWNLV